MALDALAILVFYAGRCQRCGRRVRKPIEYHGSYFGPKCIRMVESIVDGPARKR